MNEFVKNSAIALNFTNVSFECSFSVNMHIALISSDNDGISQSNKQHVCFAFAEIYLKQRSDWGVTTSRDIFPKYSIPYLTSVASKHTETISVLSVRGNIYIYINI